MKLICSWSHKKSIETFNAKLCTHTREPHAYFQLEKSSVYLLIYRKRLRTLQSTSGCLFKNYALIKGHWQLIKCSTLLIKTSHSLRQDFRFFKMLAKTAPSNWIFLNPYSFRKECTFLIRKRCTKYFRSA